jgi:ubiquinone/menaquinone biosynthesis C-methylase UbiE
LAASSLGRAYKALVVQQMAIERGHTVIDLGCGPGADLRAFAESVGPSGTVLGLDSDESAVEKARRAVADLTNVRVQKGDLHIDRAHTDRVLQHAVDPARALAEVRRVLRPGGSAVFAEPDWDTLVIDFPRPTVASAYRRFITDRVVRNSRIGRQLPRLAEAARLIVTRIVPVTAVFSDANEADKILGFHRVTERAVTADYLAAADAEEWLAYLAPVLRIGDALRRGRRASIGRPRVRELRPAVGRGDSNPRPRS